MDWFGKIFSKFLKYSLSIELRDMDWAMESCLKFKMASFNTSKPLSWRVLTRAILVSKASSSNAIFKEIPLFSFDLPY